MYMKIRDTELLPTDVVGCCCDVDDDVFCVGLMASLCHKELILKYLWKAISTEEQTDK